MHRARLVKRQTRTEFVSAVLNVRAVPEGDSLSRASEGIRHGHPFEAALRHQQLARSHLRLK